MKTLKQTQENGVDCIYLDGVKFEKTNELPEGTKEFFKYEGDYYYR